MDTNERPQRKKSAKPPKTGLSRYIDIRWVLSITVLSFFISVVFSYISTEGLKNVDNQIAFVMLLLLILVGVLFDTIGVAATSTTDKEFHSMSAKRVKGAKEAVWLAKNAEKVATICNDVVGDIIGIISGATGALIITRITQGLGIFATLVITLSVTGLIASLTIGGKAIGKAVGISKSVAIIHTAGKILAFLPIKLKK